VIRFRAFRNGDPPALAELWNRGLPEREVVRPLGAHEFDELVLGRLHFEADGLILAEEEGRLAGFVHAGFGPESPGGPSHRIDRDLGTIAMLVVDPDRDDPALELSLFAEAENYLRRRGAKVLYAGGQVELSSYYWGVYGGSECSGVLDTHRAFRRGALGSGYQPVAQSILFELDLSAPEVRDPKSSLVRRQTRLHVVEDALPATWWESSAIGHTQITRFRLLAKEDDRELARASTWDMAAFGRLDGKARTGLIDVEVADGERRKGYGRFLVSEILRHARGQWGEFVSVQTRSTNHAAVALYQSMGFKPVESSTLFRRPGSRGG
jgi:ribosomal protein S18 acetylase RimI-like enzyme